VAIIGCSNDSVENNAKFAKEQGFTFPLICDLDLAVAIAYHAAPNASAGKASRVAALIGADGHIEEYYPTVDAKVRIISGAFPPTPDSLDGDDLQSAIVRGAVGHLTSPAQAHRDGSRLNTIPSLAGVSRAAACAALEASVQDDSPGAQLSSPLDGTVPRAEERLCGSGRGGAEAGGWICLQARLFVSRRGA